MLPDRIEPRTAQTARRDPAEAPVACARCDRRTDPEAMRLWSERRRFRVVSPGDPGGFRYEYGDRHFGVCSPCHLELGKSGEVSDLRRRRGVRILLAAMATGIAIILITPMVLPQLMSAFWQSEGAKAARIVGR
jgi:hypothetical protein